MAAIGTIYNKSNWNSFSDFNMSNGWVLSGGKLVSPADSTKILQRTYVSALDGYSIKVRANSANLVMEIHCIAENNQNIVCSIVGGYARTVFTYNSDQTQSATSITINPSDVIEYEFSKVGRSFLFKITNVNTSQSVSVVPSASSYPPSFRLRFYAPISTTLLSITHTSDIEKGGLFAMGDSITAGGNSSTIENRWATLAGLKVEAGPGDRSTEMLALLPEVFNFIKPATVFMTIGTNDQDINVWKSNILSLRNQIEAKGIGFVACSPYANNIRDMSPFKTFIEANFEKNIDFFTATKASGGWGLNPTYDFGDGVHPNDVGHAAIADDFLASPWHDYMPPASVANQYQARKMTMQYL